MRKSFSAAFVSILASFAMSALALPSTSEKLASSIVSTNDVKTIVRNILHLSGRYMFDESSNTCYRRVNTNDFIVLYAVTNIDLTAEENCEALEWMEEHWREIVFPSESQEPEKNPDENVEPTAE